MWPFKKKEKPITDGFQFKKYNKWEFTDFFGNIRRFEMFSTFETSLFGELVLCADFRIVELKDSGNIQSITKEYFEMDGYIPEDIFDKFMMNRCMSKYDESKTQHDDLCNRQEKNAKIYGFEPWS